MIGFVLKLARDAGWLSFQGVFAGSLKLNKLLKKQSSQLCLSVPQILYCPVKIEIGYLV